ncbi:putative transketolase C-terminal section [Tepidanaerobacter acetatoxydans Re1]|uniref:Putative transketolase C-terminal section n=1 Tax=Tepidanaerobacter acetatoxydans (strain DSM 21804 / JCM 16047 / Re1) TaxID=1209989 RepID=F4LR63_TEPAE|nr:transketolase family protein [Tepidanaerobacter acetatoxydans]AEE92216.1 1-deoxy-D-xylulose-5-phosphate synthase [Tepidanaerobacter acetatoxydans Re1]CCP27086.1 putative transketolase C-terminal section [Tepidanaerobacter acetatoxydans Re1]
MTNMKSPRIAYGEALVELGLKNKQVVVLDADLAHATQTVIFSEKFKDRFFNMGIAEQNMIGVAAGLALSGFIPFASTFAIFGAGRAFEQIRNTVCYPNLNVKIAVTHAGITVGEDGASHQAIEDISLMRSIPNMKVVVPCDAIETKKAIFAAAKIHGPVYIRIARPVAPIITEENTDFKIGKAQILRKGKDLSIFATGLMVDKAMKAANVLYGKGIETTVVNIHTIKPLDEELVLSEAANTGKVITVEEHSIIGGLGSAIAETLIGRLPVKMKRIGLNDTFGQSGNPNALMEYYGLTVENIVKTVNEILN